MPLSRNDAEHLLLERLNADPAAADRFVIIGSELAPRGDCWVITANSAAYVETGDISRMYVGVSAYLVDTDSGAIEIVGSGQQVEEALQDRYDRLDAGSRHYVLVATSAHDDKAAILRLHRALDCSLAIARKLLFAPNRQWLHGRKQALQQAADLLCRYGVAVGIELSDTITGLAQVPDWPLAIDELREPICNRVTSAATGEE